MHARYGGAGLTRGALGEHGTKGGARLHSPARRLTHGSSCPSVVPACVVCVRACVRLLSVGLCACVFETECMILPVRVRGRMIYLGVCVKHALCMRVCVCDGSQARTMLCALKTSCSSGVDVNPNARLPASSADDAACRNALAAPCVASTAPSAACSNLLPTACSTALAVEYASCPLDAPGPCMTMSCLHGVEFGTRGMYKAQSCERDCRTKLSTVYTKLNHGIPGKLQHARACMRVQRLCRECSELN